MPRKAYMLDTETQTAEVSSSETKILAWSICEIDNIDKFNYGTDIVSLMQFMRDNLGDYYVHNLRFDGEFILYWLLENGWVENFNKKAKPFTFKATISKMAQWYQVDLCYARKGRNIEHSTLIDSLKKLPFSVKQIGKSFGGALRKTTANYDSDFNSANWVNDEKAKEYIHNDVAVVANALRQGFDNGLTHMTIGSDALADYKNLIGKKRYERWFPTISQALYDNLKLYYRGGFTQAIKQHAGKDIQGGMVYDVNSLYPWALRESLLPYGAPMPFEGKYQTDDKFPLYVQQIRCIFKLKPKHIPMIQIKHNPFYLSTDYRNDSRGESVTLWLASPDLALFFEHYDVYALEYIQGYMFAGRHDMFDKYIDKWMGVKEQATIEHNLGRRQQAKLMLNNLYGKFASNPDVTGKHPIIDDNGGLKLVVEQPESVAPKYLPVAVFVTAWARDKTIRAAQAVYDRILYCDTDSIHIMGTTIPHEIADDIDPVKLGYWKHESTFGRAKFLRAKTYIEDIDCGQNAVSEDDINEGNNLVSYPFGSKQNQQVLSINKQNASYYIRDIQGNEQWVPIKDCYKLHIRCAGLPDKSRRIVDWDNFEFGFEVTDKLMPKHVKGGILLVPRVWKLKKNGGIFG